MKQSSAMLEGDKPVRTWAQELVYFYSEGYTDAEVAAALKTPIKEYYKRVNDDKVFAQLVDYGRTLSQAFWEGQVRKNLNNKTFNTSAWAFFMKNKYGWADKTEVASTTENVNMDIDTLRSDVFAKVNKFLKKHSPEITDAQQALAPIMRELNNEQ